jgi:hypothetical protein
MIIDVAKLKSAYLRRMKEFRQASSNKCHEGDLHIRIKVMHIHMRETGLKEEKELK